MTSRKKPGVLEVELNKFKRADLVALLVSGEVSGLYPPDVHSVRRWRLKRECDAAAAADKAAREEADSLFEKYRAEIAIDGHRRHAEVGAALAAYQAASRKAERTFAERSAAHERLMAFYDEAARGR